MYDMSQGMNQMSGYTNPTQMAYQQRLSQIMQQYPQYANPYNQMQQSMQQPIQQPRPTQSDYRCISVTSVEEANAFIPDPMGTLAIFRDSSKNCFYTKQTMPDGTASFNTYRLDNSPVPVEQPKQYAELSTVSALYEHIQNLESQINQMKEDMNNATSTRDSEPTDPTGNPTVSSKPIIKPAGGNRTNIRPDA